MQNIKINLRLPSNREYKALPWELREAKKFEIIKMTKDCLIEYPLPAEPKASVSIMVGSKALPENIHISPMVSVLRRLGWIADNSTIKIRTIDTPDCVSLYFEDQI